MSEQNLEYPTTVQSRKSNLLKPFLEAFSATLRPLGYFMKWQLSCVSLFGHWLDLQGIPLEAIDDSHVDRFIEDRRVRNRPDRGHGKVVRRFLVHLREQGTIAPIQETRRLSPMEQLERQYERYLLVERGLNSATVVNRLHFVHRFLSDRLEVSSLPLRELHASDISDYLLRLAPGMRPTSAKTMVTALRSFFRFLLQQGVIEIDLARNVPSVANWRLAAIPKYLEPEQVDHLLSVCDRDTAIGRRDYAILLLLARVGLRAGEVVKLELDDIHWRSGELRIRGKGLTNHQIPLLREVGEAIATYLQEDRPSCSSRRVFIRVMAPIRGLDSSDAVTHVVDRALRRAELQAPVRGACLLRHSLATRLLRNGASMLEIGEILRHKSTDTTEIYAKVDLGGLQSIARPWHQKGDAR